MKQSFAKFLLTVNWVASAINLICIIVVFLEKESNSNLRSTKEILIETNPLIFLMKK